MYSHGPPNWKQRLAQSYDAAQGWIVVTIIGVAIGLNAAFLNIVTEWLSDIKMGYCTTAFYLNENFCCWGEDNGMYGATRRKQNANWCRMSALAPVDGLRADELFPIHHLCGTHTLSQQGGRIATNFDRQHSPLLRQPSFDHLRHTLLALVSPKSSALLLVSS